MKTLTEHPAKFSQVILENILPHVEEINPKNILDPFAGQGGVHWLRQFGFNTVGVELEPEWACQSPHTIIGDALNLPFSDEIFDCVISSFCYGNRLADNYVPKDDSKRFSYRISLGRPLSDGSGAAFQWGKQYRDFHMKALLEVRRVLSPNGTFILNMSNHIRDKKVVNVVDWYISRLDMLGFNIVTVQNIPTPRMGFGANGKSRVEFEQIIVCR